MLSNANSAGGIIGRFLSELGNEDLGNESVGKANLSDAHTIGKVLVDLDEVAVFHCRDASARCAESRQLLAPGAGGDGF